MMSLTRCVQVMTLLICCAMPVSGTGNLSAETPPEPTPETVPPKAKEPEGKPKEPEAKHKESEPKPQDAKPKDADQKGKEPEPKSKDNDSKKGEPDSKTKESTKPADGKQGQPEHKAKETDQKHGEAEQKAKETEQKAKEMEKPKEAEQKPKDAELTEKPCPAMPQAAEGKATTDSSSPADVPAGDKKAAEPETKKAIRSPMVTAKLALMADPRLFPYDIEVDSKDKDLVLLGKVVSESDKHVATEIVRCLEGVHAVENRMKVEADATHGLAAERDKVITQLVKERFEKSKTLQSIKFDVKTEHGVVFLAGSTRFQVIILEAAQAARQVPGVKAVNTEAMRIVAGE